MSDRCSLTMRVRRKDLPKLAAATGIRPAEIEAMVADEDQGVGTLQVDEVNYGWMAARESIAAAGIAFAGFHGSGGTYPPCAFAAHGGKMIEVPVSWDGEPEVGIVAGPGGRPVADPEGLALIERYDLLKARAEAALAGKEE